MLDLNFPIEYFPEPMKNYINECSEKDGLIKEYMCGASVALLSGLIGINIKLEVTATHTETAMLWIAIVGSSGTKKTPSINAILKPLENIDEASYKKYQKELAVHKEDTENNPKPFFKQKVVDDITMESLSSVMYNNKDGLLMKKDELIGMVYEGNRYKANSGAEQRMLSIYSNSSYPINRKTGDDVMLITNPFLTLLGGIQPSVLKELFANNRSENGFISRILFVYPVNIELKVPQDGCSTETKEKYFEFIKTIHETIQNLECNKIIKLSDKAMKIYRDWQENHIYPILKDEDENELIKATTSKLEAVALRVALIIECSDKLSRKFEPIEVSIASVLAAIEITEYFRLNFLEVLRIASNKVELINPNEYRCLKEFSKNVIQANSIDKQAQVVNLLYAGYSNATINKALNIPKSTISDYGKA